MKRPPFQGDVEKAQLEKICRVLGVPTEETWPGVMTLQHAQVGAGRADDQPVPVPVPSHLRRCSFVASRTVARWWCVGRNG